MLNMKMRKNKMGFSLAEMVIVIAIIVILAGASAVGVVAWVRKANETKDKVELNNGDNFEAAALSEVAAAVPSAPSYVIPKETAQTPANEETTTVKEETTTVKEETTTVKHQETTTVREETTTVREETTTVREETTTVKQQDGGGTSNGMTFTAGAGNGTAGVVSYTTSGNTTQFKLTGLNGYGDYSCSITKSGKDYIFDMGSLMYQINYAFPGYNYSGNQSVYTLTGEQKTWLTNNYHISFE